MRKLFTLLIALMALTVSSWATVTQQQIGSFYYELDDENHTATLIKLPGSGDWASYELTGDITIPGTVNDGVSDYTVTTIGTKAFVNVGITSVTIEEGVTDINELAFFGSSSLQTATLPSTITYLGNQSFDFTALTAFVITATSPASFGYGDPMKNVSTLEHIYVPAASVDAYKTAWTSYASLIEEKPVWIKWNQAKVASVYVYMSSGYANPQSQTIDDAIIVTANAPEYGDYSQFSTYVDDVYHTSNTSISLENGGTMTFAPTSGKLKSIVIECGYKDPSLSVAGSGWTWNSTGTYSGQLIWTSATEEGASSVVLANNGSSFYFGSISSIDFTFASDDPEPTPEPVISTVIWEGTDLTNVDVWASNSDPDSQTIEGSIKIKVTATAPESEDYSQFKTYDENNTSISVDANGTLTFEPVSGKLTSIIIESDYAGRTETLVEGSGWDWIPSGEYSGQLKWTSETEEGASSVTLACNGSTYGCYFSYVSSVKFTFAAEEAASADPVSQGPVTWDFANDAELASIYLRQYTQYNFGGYYQEYYDNHYEDSVKNFKDIVATISAMTDGSYACFSNQNNYSIDLENGGTLTFSTELGQFQSIVINTTSNGSSSGDWTWVSEEHTLTWAGTPANSVVLNNIDISDITSIVFTFVSSASAAPEPTEIATIHFAEIYHYEVTEFTHIDSDCGHRPSVSIPSFNVWLENENGQDITDVMPLTVTSSDESVVTVSLGDYYGPTDPDRLITCQPTGYGTATITATFAGNETYFPAQASFTYNFYRNETPMAECALVDKNGVPVTSIVATEGDLIDAPYLARVDGEDLCYTYLAMATTTNRSRWRLNPETNRWDYFYPKKAGLDTIVFTYYRESFFDSRETEDYKYWDQGVEVRIPVQINPLITPIGASAQMNMNPAVNANMAFSNTENDFYNLEEDQLEIQSVVDPVALQLAIDSMAAGTKDWNDLLPGATTFNVEPGNGKLNIQCETTAGYELKVLIRGHGTVSVSQPSMGIAEVDYDVDEVTTVLIYLAATSGGSSAPRRAPAATKDAAPKAIIKAISVIPMVEVTAKPDPENGDVYYSTFYDSEKKYQLPAGTEAYVAELNTNELLMTKIAENGQVIPAGNAVILKSEAASVDLIATDDAPVSFSATNDLHGVDSETAAPANCYVLSGHSTDNSVTGVGFYEFTGTIPAHKAYLTVSGGAAYAPKKLRFVFNNEQQATGIDNAAEALKSEKRIENGQLIIIKNGVRYNAQGQIVK